MTQLTKILFGSALAVAFAASAQAEPAGLALKGRSVQTAHQTKVENMKRSDALASAANVYSIDVPVSFGQRTR